MFYVGGVFSTLVVMIAVTWGCWYTARPWTPWIASICAFSVMIIQGWFVWRRVRGATPMLKGLQGELIAAEWLGELARDGYSIFHDLQGPRGNIDHVAVGPAGVLVIETKYRTKRPGEKVRYDGSRLMVGNCDVSRQHLGQVRACRDEVTRRLREFSPIAAMLPVRAVLVYPGWDIEESSGAEVWVLNPKRRVAKWAAQEQRQRGSVPEEQIREAQRMFDKWAREGLD